MWLWQRPNPSPSPSQPSSVLARSWDSAEEVDGNRTHLPTISYLYTVCTLVCVYTTITPTPIFNRTIITYENFSSHDFLFHCSTLFLILLLRCMHVHVCMLVTCRAVDCPWPFINAEFISIDKSILNTCVIVSVSGLHCWVCRS